VFTALLYWLRVLASYTRAIYLAFYLLKMLHADGRCSVASFCSPLEIVTRVRATAEKLRDLAAQGQEAHEFHSCGSIRLRAMRSAQDDEFDCIFGIYSILGCVWEHGINAIIKM
jgi:hypothetical protein